MLPAVDRNVSVWDYAERWLAHVRGGLKARTIESYRGKLDLHILPAFGSLPLRKLHRSAIKALLAEKRAAGLGVDSVRLIHATLRGMPNAAVDEGIARPIPQRASGAGCAALAPLRSGRSRSARSMLDSSSASSRPRNGKTLGSSRCSSCSRGPAWAKCLPSSGATST
jgi:hypothetical protein